MKSKHRNRKVIYAAVLASSMFVLNPPGASAATHPTKATSPTDSNITFWVMDALREDPRILTQDIQVHTADGIVTLTGSTWDLAGRYYAEREASKIMGVRGVVDELNVEPSFRSDTDVGQDVRRRLMDSSTIVSPGIGVAVQNGVVTLTGRVASWAELRQAGLLAREVRGVRKVDNKLEIAGIDTKRPDAQIKKDVEATLARDVYLTNVPIGVTVKNGDVVLKGRVGSAYEQKRAYEDAWIDGVINVKNDMTVAPWSDQDVREKAPKLTNEQLKQAVQAELDQDLRIQDPYTVHVSASYGEVTLWGRVPSYHQKQAAERDAFDVEGTHWVKNLLAVHSHQRTDQAILDDVKFALDTNYALSGLNIQPRVSDGVVVLSGNATSIYERDRASRVAGDIMGVRDVINHISVEQLPEYSNAALTREIRDRLNADAETYRVADSITVKVDNGAAVLTGEVANWAQYKEAADLALQTRGIRSVDNRLGVADTGYPVMKD